MVIIMEQGADPADVDTVIASVQREGLTPFVNPGVERKVIAVLGAIDTAKAQLADRFQNLPGVERVTLISEPYKLSSRGYHPEDSIVEVNGVRPSRSTAAMTASTLEASAPCSMMMTIKSSSRSPPPHPKPPTDL